MSAKQKRRQKRDRELIKLGRGAKEAIGEIQADLEASKAEAARAVELAKQSSARTERVLSEKEAALETAIGEASSAGEVITLLRDRINVITRERDQVIADAVEKANVNWASTVEGLRREHTGEVAELHRGFIAEKARLEGLVRAADQRAERYKSEWEDPAKLRRRLMEKELDNQRLRTELSKAKNAPPEEIRVQVGSIAGRL